MGTFIQKLSLNIDAEQMLTDFNTVLSVCPWPIGNQIGLRHRTGAIDHWTDGAGSLYDYESNTHNANESVFANWNPAAPEYLKSIVATLLGSYQWGIGRVRYMRLLPKTGLTVHNDLEPRFHYVFDTNQYCYICDSQPKNHAICYHLPADGNFYQVDTTRNHYVYNGGTTERIHLVICPVVPNK